MKIVQRAINQSAYQALLEGGYSPIKARLFAARGVTQPEELDLALAKLVPPDKLSQNMRMASILATAIAEQKKILVIGDYDADGATATAVAVKGLRMLGAVVDYLIPNRFGFGYGLSVGIVEIAAASSPDFILTVDNGIASVDGVARANALGIKVLITDHHLPGDTSPQAACIVNPNQHGCEFPSKNLAGVGVMFYVLLALRARLREQGLYQNTPEPNLIQLLDLVALGTIADLVKLDTNNRILVEHGLRRIRTGKSCLAIQALLRLAGRDARSCNAQDLAFSVAPRLNAAGRLDDMSVGVACLLAEDASEVNGFAEQLHTLNQERKGIEADMRDAASIVLQDVDVSSQYSLSVYQPEWHQGVIGILASRLKEQYHRPTIVFASAEDGKLKGSGRSIKGLHLRDALDLVSKRLPDVILQFGGHAMAAGLTIRQTRLSEFSVCFEQVVSELISHIDLEAVTEVDAPLQAEELTLETAADLELTVWGQAFPPPAFYDEFEVLQQRLLGEKHLKLQLGKAGLRLEAIFFGQESFLPERVGLVYQPKLNEYQGLRSLQLHISYATSVSDGV